MEASIKCCDYFGAIRHKFNWYSFEDNNGEKTYCMPTILSQDGHTQIRVNNCPSCGKEVRGIELKDTIKRTT